MGRTVSIKLLADVAGWVSGLGRAGMAAKDFSGELNKAASGGKVEQITRATAGLGLGLAGVAGAAIKMSMDFDKSMSAVSAATHAPAATMDQLRQAAIQAGKDTQYSATQAADGITELAKAGIGASDILGGGLKGALSLAAAGQISVSEAAQTAASAMTQFKLSGDKVPHVADLLAAAAGKAQGSVHDMGYALNQSGLVASQFHLSIEDTTGALAEFANAGLIGSDAGTSFKTMLLAMANPTSITQKKMDELGISFYDANGKFLGLAGVADMLQKKLGGLTEQERNAALGQIFGNDAIRSATVLYKDGAKGVEEWQKKVNDQGYATDTAAKLTDNLAGDLERLKGSLETVAIESGGGATKGLRTLTQGANDLVNAFADLPGWLQSSITVMSGLGGASLLAISGFMKARGTVKDFMDELRDMGPRGASAAEGLAKVAGLAGRLGLVGAAVGGAFEAFQLFGTWALRKTAPVKANIDDLTQSIKDFAQTGQATGELAAKYGDALQRIHDDVVGVTKGMADFAAQQELVRQGLSDPSVMENWNPVDPQAVQRIKDLDSALTQLVKGGGATQAAVFLRELESSGKLTAGQYAQLITMLPSYSAATQTATAANGGLAKGFGTAAANASTMKSKLEDAIAAGQKMTDVWLQLNGALLSSNKTELAAQQAIDAVKKSFQDNGKSIDESGLKYDKHGKLVKQNADQIRANSEAALKNRVAIGDAAKAAADAAQSVYEETGSVKEANKTYQDHIKQLRGVLGEMGFNKKQIDTLIASYGKMPDDIYTKIHQPGMDDALTKTNNLWKALNKVDGGWVAALHTTGYASVATDLRHLLAAQQAAKSGNGNLNEANRELGHFFAGGGRVGGWSPHPRADNIPAWLTAEEWVHPVAAVKYYGPQLMAAIQHRQVPRELLAAFASGDLGQMGDLPLSRADGGSVTLPFPVTAARAWIPSMDEVMAKVGGQAWPFLHAQDGKPYVWASAGPGGYDCSGIVSAVYNLLHGRNPYHHTFSTASLPGSWFPKAGIGGPLTAAWSNPGEAPASSTTGHMMGMAGGLTFESTGSRGVHLGATTRRLTDFAHIAHYGEGGHVAMQDGGYITEPIFGVGASGRTYSFGENYVPERVTPNAGGAGGGDFYATVYVTAPVGSSPKEIGREISIVLDSYCRGGGRVNLRGTVTP